MLGDGVGRDEYIGQKHGGCRIIESSAGFVDAFRTEKRPTPIGQSVLNVFVEDVAFSSRLQPPESLLHAAVAVWIREYRIWTGIQ
jgi:hypothetical protein